MSRWFGGVVYEPVLNDCVVELKKVETGKEKMLGWAKPGVVGG